MNETPEERRKRILERRRQVILEMKIRGLALEGKSISAAYY